MINTTIYTLPPGLFKPGMCDICLSPALIKYRDTQTGMMIGDCCLRAFTFAKRLICQDADNTMPLTAHREIKPTNG